MIFWVVGALVDDIGLGVAGGRADAGGDAVAAGGVEQAGLGRAARGGAAEQGLERLALRAFGRQAACRRPAASARNRAGSPAARCARRRTRRAPSACRCRSAPSASAGRPRRKRALRMFIGSFWRRVRRHVSRTRNARTSKSRTPMVIAASATLKTKKGLHVAEMQVGEVDDIAEADAIDDIAERAAEDQPEREPVAAPASRARSTAPRRRRSRRSSRPAASAAVSFWRLGKPEATPKFSTQVRLKIGSSTICCTRSRSSGSVTIHCVAWSATKMASGERVGRSAELTPFTTSSQRAHRAPSSVTSGKEPPAAAAFGDCRSWSTLQRVARADARHDEHFGEQVGVSSASGQA